MRYLHNVIAFALLIVVIVGLVAVSGCVSPELLRPAAQDNAANLRDLIENNKQIHDAYASLLRSEIQALKVVKLENVARVADDLAAGVSSGLDRAAKRETVRTELKKNVQRIQESSLNLSADQLADVKPLIGDVAGGLLTEDEAIDDCLNVKQILDVKPDPETLYGLLEPKLRNVHVIQSFEAGADTLQRAYANYVAVINDQSDLALKHAAAFLEFSRANTDYLQLFKGAAQDKEIQERVLSLVKDPKAKAKAQSIFDEIGKLSAEPTEVLPPQAH